MKCALVQQAARTTTGTQDFTDAAFSSDCLAAINISGRGTVEDTAAATAAVEIGFTDLTNSLSLASAVADNSATPGMRGSVANNSMLGSVIASGSVRTVAPFNASLASGLQVIYSTAPPAADLENMLLLGGPGVEFKAVTALFTGAPNTDQVINHNLSGPPTAIFVIGNRSVSFASAAHYLATAGFWTAAAQTGFGLTQQNNVVPTNTGAIIRSSTDSGIVVSTTPAVNNSVVISSVDATTFTVGVGGGGNNMALTFLCMRGTTTPMFAKTGIGTTRTTTGNQAVTGVGGKPQVLITIPTRLLSTSLASDDTAGGWGIGIACDNGGVTQQKSVAATVQDNVNPTVSKSMCSSKALLVLDNTGAKDVEATVASWDSDGWTYNFSNVAASPLEYIYLAFGVVSTIGPIAQSMKNRQRWN